MSNASVPSVGPQINNRHDMLDVLRGIAILGILPVNLPAFSLPFAAYANPAVMGALEGADLWAWLLTQVLFDTKFITLFSFLFGAGIALFCEHAVAAQDAPGLRHYRRMFGLLAIGLVHAYLLWFGDILVSYAVMGMLLYLFVRSGLSARALALMGGGLVLLNLLALVGGAASMPQWPAEDLANAAAEWFPAAEVLEREIAIYRGGWLGQLNLRVSQAMALQVPVLIFTGPRLFGLMLLGVAAYRSGWLLAQKSAGFYFVSAVVGIGGGVLLSWQGAQAHLANGFAMEHSMLAGQVPQYIASLLQAFGYASLVLGFFAAQKAGPLTRLFAPVGRMAFSNYLSQTVLCTLFFYGHGFGQFGYWSHAELWGVAVCIWIAQVLWSHWWMRRFRFGPAEALWRGLTYGRWALQTVRD
jgi:uncharacterized protein